MSARCTQASPSPPSRHRHFLLCNALLKNQDQAARHLPLIERLCKLGVDPA